MQQATREHIDYAPFGMRVAAVLVDTVLLIVVLAIVLFVVAVSRGNVDLQDPAAAQQLSRELSSSQLPVNYLTYAAIFVYYVVFEGLFGASIGKLLLGMRVVMRDGTRATGFAVVVRNLVRIPELMLLYIPSAISCLASPRRERLGDYAARTVVVRQRSRTVMLYGQPPQAPPYGAPGGPPVAPPYGGPGATPQSGPPAPQAPPAPAAWPPPDQPAAVPVWTPPPTVDAALVRLKTATLAARGAHLTYLRFSERELAAGAGEHAGGYSEEYVSAWFTLADAVAELKAARADLDRAAAQAGTAAQDAVSRQPDLVHLLAELAPYFEAGDDDGEIHEAFLAVARAEAASRAGDAPDPSPS